MTAPEVPHGERPDRRSWLFVGIAWILVGVPLLWGIVTTIRKALPLFR